MKKKAKIKSNEELLALAQLIDQPAWRRKMARTLGGFETVYLPHHFSLPPANYHPTLDAILTDHKKRFLNIIGHRGSGKSTKANLSAVLWFALEHANRYPFIIIAADTQMQAKTHIANIREELENNELLQADYSLDLSRVEWQKLDFTLPNGVRILARSRGQKVRGLKHRQHRISAIVIDDPEDIEFARKKENRDKTERWLRQEVLPALGPRGRCIIIGNMVHKDCLVARLEQDKEFETYKFPLVDDQGQCQWPALYPTQEDLDRLRALAGNVGWQREYLLRPVAEEGQEIKDEWIRYYDSLPAEWTAKGVGVDLAISKSDKADYTAMVPAMIQHDSEGQPHIYILPHIVNERLSFKETIDQAQALARELGDSIFFVEKVAYQQAAIEEMERKLLSVHPVKPGSDKRARLRTIAPYIQNGTVLFPRRGAEDLIMQLTGFGIEAHDDLVDAFVYVVRGLVDMALNPPEVVTF